MPFINPDFPGRVFQNFEELQEAITRLNEIGKTREQILEDESPIPIPEKEDIEKVKIDYLNPNQNVVHIVAELKTTSEYMRSLLNILRGNTNMLTQLSERINQLNDTVKQIWSKLSVLNSSYETNTQKIEMGKNKDGLPIGIELFAYTTLKGTSSPKLAKCKITPEGYQVGETIVKSLSKAAQIASGNIRNGYNWWRISPNGPTVKEFYNINKRKAREVG